MALNYEKLMATSHNDIERVYGDVETMLYAQSVGFGRDAIDRKELAYVYEDGGVLRTVPTLASASTKNVRFMKSHSGLLRCKMSCSAATELTESHRAS